MRTVLAIALSLLAACNTVPMKLTETKRVPESSCVSLRYVSAPTEATVSVVYDHRGGLRYIVSVDNEPHCRMSEHGERLDLKLPPGQHIIRVAYMRMTEVEPGPPATVTVSEPGPIRAIRIQRDENAGQVSRFTLVTE